MARRAVIREPEDCAPSTTTTPTDIPEMMRFRIGKFCGPGNVSIANAEMIEARFHLGKDLLVLLGISHVDPANQDANCRPGERTQRPLMSAGINAARQPADDYQTPMSQIPGQFLRHLIPERGRTTRPDDGNQVANKKFNVSAHIQEGWGS